MAKISISNGNAKMGGIPSVSLPACVTCNPDAPCFKTCYARRLAARRAKVAEAYERNLEELTTSPASYWLQVRAAACMTRFFRYHVSGDMPNASYFAEMVATARQLPGTRGGYTYTLRARRDDSERDLVYVVYLDRVNVSRGVVTEYIGRTCGFSVDTVDVLRYGQRVYRFYAKEARGE